MSAVPISGLFDPSPQMGPPVELFDHQTYTYQDVATFKKVKKHTVYKWVREGSIPSPVYTGGTARFTAEQVAVILSNSIVPGTYQPADSIRRNASKKSMAKRMKAKKVAAKKKVTAKKKPATKKGGKKK